MAIESLSVSSVEQQHDLATGNSKKHSLSDIDISVVEQSRDFVRSVPNVNSVKHGEFSMRLGVEQFGESRVTGLGTPSDPPKVVTPPPSSISKQQPSFDRSHPAAPDTTLVLSEHQRYLQRQQHYRQVEQYQPKIEVQTSPLQFVEPVSKDLAIESVVVPQQDSQLRSEVKQVVSHPIAGESQAIEPIKAMEQLAMQQPKTHRTAQSKNNMDNSVHIGSINVTVLADESLSVEPKQKSRQPWSNVASTSNDGWASKHYLRRV
jgi:hypothetical protein